MIKKNVYESYTSFFREFVDLIKLKGYPWFIPFIIGVIVRSVFVLSTDFPINDGGMFYTMVQDIKQANYSLPIYTSYNHANIPFAYPPLSFYVTAFLSDILPVSLIDLFRFLPLTFSILTIFVFFKLVEKLISREVAFYSTFAFALLPRAFEWQIMGGGLARSLGFLFSLLTLYQGIKIFKNPSKKGIFFGGVLLSLTIFSHLEWAAFACYSLVIIFLLNKKSFKNLLNLIKVIFIAALITLPWLLTIISRHSIQPFFFFTNYGVNPLNPTSLNQLAESHQLDFSFLAFLAIIGLLLTFSAPKKFFLLPIWVLIPLVVFPRSAFNLTNVPVAVLMGLSITEVLLPFINRSSLKERKVINSIIRTKLFRISLLFIVFYGLMSIAGLYYLYPWYIKNNLSSQHRLAMKWISENTDANGKFLLLTHYSDWAVDSISEWFPTLSERTSITTPQGTEWLPNNKFYQKVALHNSLRDCYKKDITCFENVVSENGEKYDYLFIAKPIKSKNDKIDTIQKTFNNLEGYSLVYENSQTEVFRKK